MTIANLQKLLLRSLPISQALGLKIIDIKDNSIRVFVPLQPNLNHKGTAFGGSQYSVCALACYGLFLDGLERNGFTTQNIVIIDARMRYLQPVVTDFEVTAEWTSDNIKNKFFADLKTLKKSKTVLNSAVICKGEMASSFTGNFLATL